MSHEAAAVVDLDEVLRKESSYSWLADTDNLSDLGNAQRLVRRHGHQIRYCHPFEKYFVYDGTRWARDTAGAITQLAVDTVRSLYREADGLPTADERKKLASHAVRSEAEGRIRAMINLARSLPGIPVQPDELDADPWAFNVRNGTVDLRTGQLRPHQPAELITKLAPVDYDPDAACPTWEAALRTWMGGDQELVEFLRRSTGYSMVGTNREQILFILWGPGANGKTTYETTLLELFGDYAQQTPSSTFIERRGDQIPNDLAALRGSRLVAAAETGENRRLNEALAKQMTGGDRITARFMRGEWFEYTPEFTPWLVTNHKPEIRGTDNAIWRRLRLIPFTTTIPPERRDPELADKLRAELAGILSWALRGCADWQQHRLTTPDAVTQATDDYRNEQDVIGRFIEDACVIHANAKAKTSDLYRTYGYWASSNGEPDTLSAKRFGQRLAERGYTPNRDSHGRWWLGIGLRSEHNA